MKNVIIIPFLSLSLMLSLFTYVAAEATLSEADSFTVLQQHVQQLSAEAIQHSLIVMDDDDTLMMMPCPDPQQLDRCQYLGGAAWYSWQKQLLGQDSNFKVANDKQTLLKIATLLLNINDMDYTEKTVPDILLQLSSARVKLLVLTARGSENLSATARQFMQCSVNATRYPHFLDLIEKNALTGISSGITSLASPFTCPIADSRAVSYQQGVMYVGGQNKGKMLRCLLKKTQSESIKYIFFIDDTLQNVKDVYQAFKNNDRYQVHAIHYTGLQAHKAALTEGVHASQLQRNAQQRWLTIKAVLAQTLQEPAAID